MGSSLCMLALVLGVYSQSPSQAVHDAAVDLVDAGRTSLCAQSNRRASSHLSTKTLDILHFLGIVDAFGHVSVRHPDNASQFIMYVLTGSCCD